MSNMWRPTDDFETDAYYLQYPEQYVSFESYLRDIQDHAYGLPDDDLSSNSEDSEVLTNDIYNNKANGTTHNENKYNSENCVTSKMRLAQLIKPYKKQCEIIGNPPTADDILDNDNQFDEISGMIREYGLGRKSNNDYVFNSTTTRKTVDSGKKYIIDRNKPILLDSEYFKMTPKIKSSSNETTNVQSNSYSDLTEQFKTVFVDNNTNAAIEKSNATTKEKQYNDNNIVNEIVDCKFENDKNFNDKHLNKHKLYTPKQLYDLKRKSKKK